MLLSMGGWFPLSPTAAPGRAWSPLFTSGPSFQSEKAGEAGSPHGAFQEIPRELGARHPFSAHPTSRRHQAD